MKATLDRPLRIFVVENHADTLRYYQLYLQSGGHEVFHSTTLAGALGAIPTAHCDVLISDLGLPDGSGWDLLTQLRETGLSHPKFAIAVSGYGTPADHEKSRAAGFRHHLLKPFDPDLLEAILEEARQEMARRS